MTMPSRVSASSSSAVAPAGRGGPGWLGTRSRPRTTRAAPRDAAAVGGLRVELVCGRLGLGGERVLARDLLLVGAHGDDLGPLLLEPHHRHPVLEVLEALGQQYRYLFSFELHIRLLCVGRFSLFLAVRLSRGGLRRRRVLGRGRVRGRRQLPCRPKSGPQRLRGGTGSRLPPAVRLMGLPRAPRRSLGPAALRRSGRRGGGPRLLSSRGPGWCGAWWRRSPPRARCAAPRRGAPSPP